MMTRTLFLVFALAVPATSTPSGPVIQNEPAPVAVLVRFENELHLKSGPTGRRVTKSDIGRVLHEGDVLTCKTDASSFTLLNAAMKEVQIKGQCTQGYVLPAPAGNYSQILQRYGRTGGRSRGTLPGFLLWPVTGVRTLPATASHLQWRKQSSGTVTATATASAGDRVIWTRTGIDASLGEWHDTALAAALQAEVDAGDLVVRLDVRISEAMNGSATIDLLDKAAQRKLDGDLAASTTGLGDEARRLVRADVYLLANLPREALDESVAMLERAPESAFLLAKAAALAVEISDPRAVDLVKRSRAAEGNQD